MMKNKKAIDFISLLLSGLFLFFSFPACTNQTKPSTAASTISRDQAIQAAITDCKIPHLELVGEPQNIRANLLTLEDAYQLIRTEGETTNFDVPMDTKVWFVQMDGQLQLVGGPVPVPSDSSSFLTPTPSQPFWGTCSVILDATTGSLILLSG